MAATPMNDTIGRAMSQKIVEGSVLVKHGCFFIASVVNFCLYFKYEDVCWLGWEQCSDSPCYSWVEHVKVMGILHLL